VLRVRCSLGTASNARLSRSHCIRQEFDALSGQRLFNLGVFSVPGSSSPELSPRFLEITSGCLAGLRVQLSGIAI
jgi:hypothetical protein